MHLYQAENGRDSHMNWNVFGDWCERFFFPAISKTPRKSVLILVRIFYYLKLYVGGRRPATSCNTSRICKAKLRVGVPNQDWPSDWEMKKPKSNF